MRIAVGGFLRESHSFAPVPTRYADVRVIALKSSVHFRPDFAPRRCPPAAR